jgi:hypothetical protein
MPEQHPQGIRCAEAEEGKQSPPPSLITKLALVFAHPHLPPWTILLLQKMPVDLLFCDEQVHQGDTSVIILLLQQMKKAYGTHSMAKTPPRKRRPSTPIRRAPTGTPSKTPNRWM